MADATLTGEMRPVTPANTNVAKEAEEICSLAVQVQHDMLRIRTLAEMLVTLSDEATCEIHLRMLALSEIIAETAQMTHGEAESIERHCFTIRNPAAMEA